MSKNNIKVSYCIGIYNEEKILLKNIEQYKKNLTKILGKNNFELVLVENGSTDNSKAILKSISDNNIQALSINEKGHGLALKKAIQRSRFPYIVLTAIDIPFGFEDLKNAIKLWNEYDIIFGSKTHPQSKVNYPPHRQMLSYLFHFMLTIFFKVKIKDPHGSLFIRKNKLKGFLKYCDSSSSFLMSQIAIHGQRNNLKMIEIPVVLQESNNERKSSVRIVRDSIDTIKLIIKEYLRIKQLR